MNVLELRKKLKEFPEGEEVLVHDLETGKTFEVEDLVEKFDSPTRRVALVLKVRKD
jgi:hypothetical protein